jgi:(E)-4-hydroxy-3-methylbut-2-enyl-diphosphate synthase|uniref:4-hydroxy-3-methylbut-2-en-1-yl diphosphate synthase (flavodoxin) n=1 Tax=candidate division WOR-3 bacterium TaxID=2052148 RepID=A0A7V3PS97_UNCW3
MRSWKENWSGWGQIFSVSVPERKSISVKVRNLIVGGVAPVRVQSMTKTNTADIRATVRQIQRLAQAGCELVRVAVPDENSAAALSEIRKRVELPLVADIHFDYRLALMAIEAGFDKIRINPGNIGARWKVEEIIKAAADRGVAIRVGVNSGSLPKTCLWQAKSQVEAILRAVEVGVKPFEKLNFKMLVISAKTTETRDLIRVYQRLSRDYVYPLHLGLTEAGPVFEGVIRSIAGMAPLLLQGIGDTIRISLTGDPVLEVVAGYELLAALGLREYGPLVYSCPGCGRTEIDINRLVKETKRALKGIKVRLKVAVMGCVVNGPGEARQADFGIAGGRGRGVIFARGKVIKTVKEEQLVSELLNVIKSELQFMS